VAADEVEEAGGSGFDEPGVGSEAYVGAYDLAAAGGS
jgi:hypothetical protein